ncbi:Piso0_002549 [Millerozyma farinosa CBS 7064]|uniref:Transcription initiation factor IIA large subunit n=1 Tax=Pichia sorbitophila (strain ATCC MYA-4447 / BCRC 22081 / CBS 7064 / NBRC 10061 / NRRL Y-12695) TaxID=559304 RepID=G8YFC2_PICSO|nr:Piso0_002549 [Millerozyma farinosa CBS 7064]
MSNAETSKLYEAIIEEVISDSRQDFEDSGIDESTLTELRKIWCEKLSQTSVANFSWDEEQNIPGSYSLGGPVPPIPDDSASAALGSGSLSLDNGSGLELPNIQNDASLTYNTTADLNHPSSGGEIQFPNIDSTQRQDYDDNGTGLMLPRINQSDGSFELTISTDKGGDIIKDIKSNQQMKRRIGQSDGANDEDDEDEDDLFNDSDDINSDLDDGLESEKSDEEDADQEGQIMLCLYDRVQRVRNKWKSNLKEGVANINGKDYVFQKATGESEW